MKAKKVVEIGYLFNCLRPLGAQLKLKYKLKLKMQLIIRYLDI